MNEADGSHAFLINLCLAVASGTFLIVLARRLQLPTIVLLLLGGIGLGPEGVNLIHADALGEAFRPIVSLAVGLILFEGGLTLDLRGFAQASGVIRRLLTLGVLVTWLGTAAAIWVIFRHEVLFCIFLASLVIVTGPTVIVPLLRRIHIQPRLHGILHWEGVLIDAIGVFIAILCFEWIVAGEGGRAVWHFLIRVVAGLGFGVAGGFFIDLAIRWRVVPESLVNSFAVAAAVLGFGVTEWVMPEAGLLAVTVAGLVVGWRHPVELKQIQQFKAELTDLLIGTLFVLLAGRLELRRFLDFGEQGIWLLAAIILLVRPLNVIVSTYGSTLNWRERAFLAWVAPRGIVAASMASLFALDLARRESVFDASFVETFVYSVIATTVILQGFSAGLVARILRVRKPESTGWLVVGAHRLGAGIAAFIKRNTGAEVTVVDTNPRLVADAAERELSVLQADALDLTVLETNERLQRIGHVLALTDNIELNELICQRWREFVHREHLHRWSTQRPVDEHARAAGAGSVHWEKLPRPSLLGGELRRAEAALFEVAYAGAGSLPDAQVLLVARKDAVVLDPLALRGFAWRDGDKLLLLRRAGGFLSRGLLHGAIAEVQAGSLAEANQQLAAAAAQCEPKLNPDALLAEIAELERAMPSLLGHGVSAPHVFVPGLTRHLVVLGRVRPPLAVDGQQQPVELVFLIVSPPGDPEGHLSTLADVARVSIEAENRARLLAAAGRDDVLATVRAILE